MIGFIDVLPHGESQLCIDRIDVEEGDVVLSVSSTSSTSLCPLCGIPSDHIHSHYQRQPADLPLAGCAVRLDMNVRKFFCNNNDCERTIFCERMPSIVAPYARYTNRLVHQQQQVAFALGGEAGSRLLAIMEMAVSPDTLLRLIRKAPEPEVTTPRVLGVDEWAKRKGHSYGTILIDLEAHQPVDLLPDKSVESFAKWLEEHPGVEIISRDRGVEYIKGATEGAPDAIQVADRWHLLSNLRDMLKRFLENRRSCLRAAAENETQALKKLEQKNSDLASPNTRDESSKCGQEEHSTTETEPQAESAEMIQEKQTDTSHTLTRMQQQKSAGHARRQERYEAVRQLHQQGVSMRGIARQMRMSRHTVRKYIRTETCPMYPEDVKRGSKLDPYMSYVQQRWESGCHNASQIWRELRQMGFDGCRALVGRWAAKERIKLKNLSPSPKAPSSDPKQSPKKEVVRWSSSRAAWLFIKPEVELTCEDRQALERMKQADEKAEEAYTLGQRFVRMVRDREPEVLLPWLADATGSRIEVLKQFAKGISQDLEAVTNALSLPWSNGQTEGQVNRLKLIKRQMYGRANFDLLRKRVLAHPMRC